MSGPAVDLGAVLDALRDHLVEQAAVRAAELIAREPDGFLDVAAAAAFLACPKSRIYALASANRIPYLKDGSRLLFDRAELREFVRNGGATRP